MLTQTNAQETLQALAATAAHKAVPLEKAVAQNSGGPLVVFAEGSRTNGTCVMPFQLFDPEAEGTHNAAAAFASPANDGGGDDDDSTRQAGGEGGFGEKWGRRLPVHILATTYSFVSSNPTGDPAAPLSSVLWKLASELSNSVTGIHLHHNLIKGAAIRVDRRALQGWLAKIQENVRSRFAVGLWLRLRFEVALCARTRLPGGRGGGREGSVRACACACARRLLFGSAC